MVALQLLTQARARLKELQEERSLKLRQKARRVMSDMKKGTCFPKCLLTPCSTMHQQAGQNFACVAVIQNRYQSHCIKKR